MANPIPYVTVDQHNNDSTTGDLKTESSDMFGNANRDLRRRITYTKRSNGFLVIDGVAHQVMLLQRCGQAQTVQDK
ncbi:hypothetical protein BGZ82_005778 [Podila clonocystis]|nr:hypothetical protein BGZ82_005778 [Podila clonocystis]